MIKTFTYYSLLLLLTTQCQEEKPLLEQAIEARCECLKQFDKEKQNILEVMRCSDEVNAREEFGTLDQEKIVEGMEKQCPEAALPLDELIE